MSLDFKQLIAQAQQVKLRPEETQALQDRVAWYLAQHPVRNANERRLPSWSRWSAVVEIVTLKPLALSFKYMAIVLILALLFGGSASLAAENTVPGDTLYPIKVNVNEEVRGWLTFSQEAKADWQASRAERRLEEAEQLAVQGKLDDSKRAELEVRFEAHAEKFEQDKDRLDGTPPGLLKVSVNSDFEGVLKGHAEVLARLAQVKADDSVGVKPILEKVQGRIARVEKNREQGEESLVNKDNNFNSAAQGKLTAAQNKLSEVKDFILKANISTDTRAVAEAQLQLAQDAVAEGQTSLVAQEYVQAFTKFQLAMRLAQQAKLSAAAADKLRLELKVSGEEELELELND